MNRSDIMNVGKTLNTWIDAAGKRGEIEAVVDVLKEIKDTRQISDYEELLEKSKNLEEEARTTFYRAVALCLVLDEEEE